MTVKRTLAAGAMVAAIALTALTMQAFPVAAQGPNPPQPLLLIGANQCSTTDYTSIAATGLGLTATELRVALVSGKALEEIAKEQNVKLEDVQNALKAAREADFEQAKKDGLIPDDVTITFSGPGGVFEFAPPGGGWGPGGHFGIEVSTVLMSMWGVSPYNEINPMQVAAQAIGVSCPDLVKAVRDGKSVVQVATEKNVQVQTIIDAMVKAHQDASAKDVEEGLITKAQAEGRNRRLVERITAMISQPGGMMWLDGHGGGFGFSFDFGRPGRRFGIGKWGWSESATPVPPEATPSK
jgi:hypothetical protein